MRVIVLGIDGVPYEQIQRLAKKGKLPHFKKLLDAGQFHVLKTEVPPITAMGWPTIFTGKNPGKHGLYDFTATDREECKMETFHSPRDCKEPFVWEILEKQGILSGVVGVPMTSPFRKKPAFGEGDHLREDWVNFDEWKKKDNYSRVVHQNPEFSGRIYDMINNKFDQLDYALSEKMEKTGARFMALTVYAIDPLQHFRWHTNRTHEQKKKQLPGPDVEEGFCIIDKRMGKVMQQLNEDDVLLVVSDHGMCQLQKMFYTNKWLQEKGYLVLKQEVKKSSVQKVAEKSFVNVQTFEKLTKPIISLLIKTNTMKYMPKKMAKMYDTIRKKVLPSKKRTNEGWQKILPQVDWSKTKAYSVGCVGNIFLNIKEREKRGSVDVRDAAKVCAAIKKDFIADMKKQGLVCEVRRRDEVYAGKRIANCPDMIPLIEGGKVLTTSSYPYGEYLMDVTNEKTNPNFTKISQSATHDMYGLFGVYGKKVKGSKAQELSVRDITPTILSLFGLEQETKDMDGRVLKEFFTSMGKAQAEKAGEPVASQHIEEQKIKDVLADIKF